MDQQHVSTTRLRRDVGFEVADMHKAQRRRLDRLRDDLRDAALPAGQLNRLFTETLRAWESAFARLEQDLTTQGERILARGVTYATLRTELDRLSTVTLHALLDAELTPAGVVLCRSSDRILRLTVRGWTLVMVVLIVLAGLFTVTGTLALVPALVVMGIAVGGRAALEGLCWWQMRGNRDLAHDLDAHLQDVTARFEAALAHLPTALAEAFAEQPAG
jgi:hypothetical protein